MIYWLRRLGVALIVVPLLAVTIEAPWWKYTGVTGGGGWNTTALINLPPHPAWWLVAGVWSLALIPIGIALVIGTNRRLRRQIDDAFREPLDDQA